MTAATLAWDPGQYRRFEAERDRAALDLLVRLPGDLRPHTGQVDVHPGPRPAHP